jgi:YjbE family integral membrane protein
MPLDYLISVAQIIMIDIVLSGDNAVVIALAAHKLPAHQRHRAIMIGGGIAIFMRIVFTMIMAFLLMVPGVRLVGGLVLMWIAIKLLLEDEEHEITPDNADASAMAAIRMIFVADFMMSLDNMLAVAGASHGDWVRLLLGLLVSIAIIMTCSGLIARLMNRFPWIVWVGAAILAFTASEMILGDREVARFVVKTFGVSLNHRWEEDYMKSKTELPQFEGLAKLPEELKPLVNFEPGSVFSSPHLTYAGQMTEAHRDALLAVAGNEAEKKGIGDMYEMSRVTTPPAWVPSFLHSAIEPKFPVRYFERVQGRQYHWFASLFHAVMVGLAVGIPWVITRRRGAAGGEGHSPTVVQPPA